MYYADGHKGKGGGSVSQKGPTSHAVKKYQGNYPLRNIMILGLNSDRFEIKTCYISGKPDGKNLLDKHGKSIYLEIDHPDRSKIHTIITLIKFLITENPLILHCHRHRATVFGSIAATIAGVPYVISHIHGTERTRNVIRKFTNILIWKKIAKFVGVSNGAREDFVKSNPLVPGQKLSQYKTRWTLRHSLSSFQKKRQGID